MSYDNKTNESAKRTSNLKLIYSTFAAAIGIQSKKKLEEDFKQQSPLPFIVAGILFTLLFICSLALVAHLVTKGIT